MAAPDLHEFASRAALADVLADRVSTLLQEAVERRGAGFLAVSGGTTPAAFFAALSSRDVDWGKVTVTLIDERLVPPSSPRSNAGLVMGALLAGKAAAARFVPLYSDAPDAEAAAARANEALDAAPWPLDVAVLGMGGDGHTASFFPDADDLAGLLDPHAKPRVLSVHAPSAIEPRLTLSLPAITSADFIALHIEGAEKRKVLDTALQPGSRLPIRTVLDTAGAPVQVYWAA